MSGVKQRAIDFIYILVDDDDIPHHYSTDRMWFVGILFLLFLFWSMLCGGIASSMGRLVPWVSCVRTATAAMVRSCVFVERKFHVEVFDWIYFRPIATTYVRRSRITPACKEGRDKEGRISNRRIP